jgi:hypothetical protein
LINVCPRSKNKKYEEGLSISSLTVSSEQ